MGGVSRQGTAGHPVVVHRLASATLFLMTQALQPSVTSVMCGTAAAFVETATGGPLTRVLVTRKTAPPKRVHAAEFREKYPCPPRPRFTHGRHRAPE
jgi:hypothetical protein